MFLLKLTHTLDRHQVSYALVGGYAVALHGAVRGTIDIDIVISHTLQNFVAVERALASIGLAPRLPVKAAEVFNFREEYIEKRNLTAWSFVNPADPSQIVDVIITRDLSRMETVRKKVKNSFVRIIAIEDLLEMKRASGRPQDLADIAALEQLQ
ncbi:MAG: hypothetical protein KDD69_11100 [Bdellovibrionales bacterium]|nr:hypothetical protein [Bdellovibrionales bacterium]